MTDMIQKSGLSIAPELVRFIEEKALPGTSITAASFWVGVANIFRQLTAENKVLLRRHRGVIRGGRTTWLGTPASQGCSRRKCRGHRS